MGLDGLCCNAKYPMDVPEYITVPGTHCRVVLFSHTAGRVSQSHKMNLMLTQLSNFDNNMPIKRV